MARKTQLDELDVLQSIFYNDEFEIIKKDENENIEAIYWAHVSLPPGFVVKYVDNLETREYSYLKLSYLPPIKLHLILPGSYPSRCSPKFTIICQWLTEKKLSKLCQQLDKIWCENENMEIIYIWIDFLKNNVLSFLGYETELDISDLYSCHLKYLEFKKNNNNIKEKSCLHRQETINNEVNKENPFAPSDDSENNASEQNFERLEEEQGRSVANHPFNTKKNEFRIYCNINFKGNTAEAGSDLEIKDLCDKRAKLNLSYKTSLLKLLINYNVEQEKTEFKKKFFTCNICFSDKLGIECTKFDNCNHVFCKNCICSYFTVKINEGTVQSIKCPENKCSSDATPLQVKSIVSAELFSKYDMLLLNSALNSLDRIIYCPRSSCQYPATRDAEDNLVICPNCQYVFCTFCKMVYHGIEPCRLKSEEKRKVVEQYINASKEVKEQIEIRYGKRHVQTLVNNSMSESWIDSNCKNCPRCDVSIEKSQGCNKMVCWKCKTYFCWLCSAELDPLKPYDHFNSTDSLCANKLFYLTPLDDELEDYNSDDEQWRDWDWI